MLLLRLSSRREKKAGDKPALDATENGQYLTVHPYGVVLATVTGLPVVASVNAART